MTRYGHGSKNKGRKCAFTLAEVLITLGIIGVVAALMLPSFIENIQERIRAEQIRTVKYKFTKATEQMNSHGLIGPYESTDKFVDELQKHLKIIKRCDANNVRACWPYDTVNLGDGEMWDISKTKTGRQLKMTNDKNHNYSSDNVGIVTGDGTPMILNYNTKCSALDPEKVYTWTTFDNKPVTNKTADCVAAVFEINGKGKPNTLSQDVALFNANGLGNACALEVDGKCLSKYFYPEPLTKAECIQMRDSGEYGIDASYSCYNNDPYVGAIKECGGIQNLISSSEIDNHLYYHRTAYSAEQKQLANKNRKAIGLDEIDDKSSTFPLPNLLWTRDGKSGSECKSLVGPYTYSCRAGSYRPAAVCSSQ